MPNTYGTGENADEPRSSGGGVFSNEEYRARERSVEARARRDEANAVAAERRAAASGGSRGSSRRRSSSKLERQTRRGLRKFTATHPRRVLVAEFLMVLVIQTAAELAGDPKHEVEPHTPTPAAYMSQLVVFLVLGFASELGDEAARLAQAFGGLVLLALAMAKAPALLSALGVASQPASSLSDAVGAAGDAITSAITSVGQQVTAAAGGAGHGRHHGHHGHGHGHGGGGGGTDSTPGPPKPVKAPEFM